MPDDLLDSAQKLINDAAKSMPDAEPGTTPASTPAPAAPQPAAPEVPSPLPQEPPPAPPVEPAPAAPVPAQDKKPDVAAESAVPPTPPPAPPSTPATEPAVSPDASAVMESLLETKNPEPVVPAQPKSFKGSAPAKKGGISGVFVGIIMLLLLALPVGVYYISQQNQQLADVRSKASGNAYPPGYSCTPGTTNCGTGMYCNSSTRTCQPSGSNTYECSTSDPNACGGNPQACHCQGGDACSGTKCESNIQTACGNSGRKWCDNWSSGGNGKTCCNAGYVCCSDTNVGGSGCCQVARPTNPPGNNPTNTPPPVVNECKNLRILSASGTQLTPASLTPGQQVVLAVRGSGTPDKAHFRINGGDWQETARKNSGNEFTLDWTVPTGATEFVLESEVHVDGVWK